VYHTITDNQSEAYVWMTSSVFDGVSDVSVEYSFRVSGYDFASVYIVLL